MITEKELHEAIAECQGVRNPNANTCLKLASYYTILDHIVGKEVEVAPVYSYAPEPEVYESDTEFGQIISTINDVKLLKIMDELMTTLQVVNPRLYASVIRKLRSGD